MNQSMDKYEVLSLKEQIEAIDAKDIEKPSGKFMYETMDLEKYMVANGGAASDQWQHYLSPANAENLKILNNHGYTRNITNGYITKNAIYYKPNEKIIIDEFIDRYFEKGDGLLTYCKDMRNVWTEYFGAGGPSQEFHNMYPIKEIVRNTTKNHYVGIMLKYGSLERFIEEYEEEAEESRPYVLYKEWCDDNKFVPYPLKVIKKKLQILMYADEYGFCAQCKTKRRMLNMEKVVSKCGAPLVIGNCEVCEKVIKIME